MDSQPLFNIAFLAARWEDEYQEFQKSKLSDDLLSKLVAWQKRDVLNESASEAAFIKQFFQDLWGYSFQGDKEDGSYQCHPQFPVSRAGQTGGVGKADLALGLFSGNSEDVKIPQVLCEFKDINSGLDHAQSRKGNSRSPVRQAFDYLREARKELTGNELVEPSWAIVTDMREFRLYNRVKGQAQYQTFSLDERSLLGDNEAAAFKRFLFFKLFSSDSLLSKRGLSYLERLIKDQIIEEADIEKDFYLEYKAYREHVFKKIVEANPDFKGTKGKLVRLTQRFLDRCLFIMFCEDMGVALDFPPQLLRDVLIDYSTDRYYNENDQMPWDRMKTIFTAMRDGGVFGDHKINRFNGGLFEYLEDLSSLKIPASVFCAKNQGEGGMKTILAHPLTLLFLSAKYNFGIKNAAHQRMIDFYALGRIFEQSITELEIMEAEADGRDSLNLLTKRKRDGVYYTPEWVTKYIVDETVGLRLKEIKDRLGLSPKEEPKEKEVKEYRTYLAKKKRKDTKVPKVGGRWLQSLTNYRTVLNQFRVVDPACGSGAFLIQALDRLKREREWIANWEERITGEVALWDWAEVVNDILSKNIYGVDINPESVEIAKLALWMHTATKGKPLSSLDHNIQCGNSLVGPDFYKIRERDLFSEDEKERINVFDWEGIFPEAFAHGGFDCVIGNPPYVKLQHFRKVQESIAEYLVNAKRKDGTPLYESTQTGNFDMYLPFIEKGTELLNEHGKMGYIAPNVWMVNEYGKGLRQKLKRTRRLDRWIDFKSYQVFDEAITYTALQFFSGQPKEHISCVFAPNGQQDTGSVEWDEVKDATGFVDLPEDESWVLMPNSERALHVKLGSNCKRLDESCKRITVGIQTSADYIYHLERIGPNRYLHKAMGKKEPVEIEIDDTIMHPLVSGPEAKRYQVPDTSTYLLFPYEVTDGKVHLFTVREMNSSFPQAWAHLKNYETVLRGREKGKFDDDQWYRFGRHQNIDKQEIPKLCVAQTVPGMRVCYDADGAFYFNNVRVNGIIPRDMEMGWFLLGILNAPLADYIFKRIAKPKAGGYYEANKQFIAPLPIPNASDKEKDKLSKKAKRLQELHSKRRDLLLAVDKRLDSSQCDDAKRNEGWLWMDVKLPAELKKEGPETLTGRELMNWAKEERERRLSHHLDGINPLLRAGVSLFASTEYGELKLLAGGVPIIEGVFLDEDESAFVAAQWSQKARKTNVTEKFDAKRLMSLLLKLRKTDNPAIKKQVIKLDADIKALDTEIAKVEADMNALTYRLYKLTDEEIRLVEAG